MKTILLLGGAGINGPEGPVTGRGNRARLALLAVLATSRTRSASRDRLAALLWPDSDSDRARQMLREAVYRLRAMLGDDALVGSGDELRINESAVLCDVWQFELAVAQNRWADADRLYKGAFLDGLSFGSSAEFEHWLDAERARLSTLHARALESLAAALGATGDWTDAITVLKRRAAADPYNSRVALQIMEALDAAGDRGAALQYAALHAELFAAELGAAPDPDVAAFAERLRREPVRREPAIGMNGNGAKPVALIAPAATAAPDSDPGALNVLQENGPVKPARRGWVSRHRPWERATRRLPALGAAVILTAGLLGVRAFREHPALEANRIAILPLRTSGTDPALGIVRDAMVELLPLQFGGAVGPVAVDPGEALAAWRRSAVSAEADSRAALSVARDLHAGHVTYGSVFGTSARFTVTISVLTVKDGSVRVAPVQIHGSMDSLSSVVAAIATRLRAPLTDVRLGDVASVNNEALRAYVDGMSAYRQGNWLQAGSRVYQAFELDTTFVAAAYRFALIHAHVGPKMPVDSTDVRFRGRSQRLRGLGGQWLYKVLWPQRRRLPDEHRILLESIADSLNIFWHQEQLPRLERTVNLVPNSAEAWELLGDAYYHVGNLLGRRDWAEQATRAFGRALELDSAIARKSPGHLADLAFIDGDARSHERYSRLAAGVAWAWENPTGAVTGVTRGAPYRNYQAAILSGHPTTIRAARVAYSHAWARGEEAGADWAIRGMTIPPHELDSLLAQMEADAPSDALRREVDEWLAHASAMTGRPNRAIEPLRRSALPDSFLFYMTPNAWAEVGDSAAAEKVIALGRTRAVEGVMEQHPVQCDAGLSRLRRGDTTGVAAILATEPPIDDTIAAVSAFAMRYRRGKVAQAALCGEVLRGVLSSRTTSDLSRLLRADSLMRVMPLNYADWWNYDIALAFARRSEYALAAAAVRRHFHDTFPLQRLVLSLRQEGHWAALAGDTASAIKAYHDYLVWRSDPEPLLIPQRDSVRAELAALERGSRKWRKLARARR